MSFVSDLIGVGTDLYNNYQNIKFQKETNERNIAEARAAEERERAYNDPSAQMQRLKNAGLNPNLIYGSGTETGNLNARAATSEAPQIGLSPLDKMRASLELGLQDQQLVNLKTQGDLLDSQSSIAAHDAAVWAGRPGQATTDTWERYGMSKIPLALDTVRSTAKDVRDTLDEYSSNYKKLRSYGHSKWKSAGLPSLW